jgi:uncharacterized protein (DUF1330 family)
MPAYMIATMAITDRETYRKYTDLAPATLKRHGGRYLTRGEPVTTAEGEPFTDRMVILEFPSARHARDWLADPDYVAACKFRYASSTGRMLLQEGGTNTADPDPKI